MSNVSESIDWRHMPLEDLDRHRFIAITNSGQTLDGWLDYRPEKRACFDLDHMRRIIYHPAGHNNRSGEGIRAINVLKETKQ